MFLISSFRRVLYVVRFLLGNYPKESIQVYLWHINTIFVCRLEMVAQLQQITKQQISYDFQGR